MHSFGIAHLAALAALCGVTSARKVTFAVVAFGQKAEVNVGGTVHALNVPWPMDPFYNATIEVPDNVNKYSYVVDGKPETFERSLEAGTTATMNDFYGREITYQAMPQFRPAFNDAKGQWTRASAPEIFDRGYIPTVHFSGASADSYMAAATDATVDVLFVGPKQALKYTGVQASAKNAEFAKAQLKVEFPGQVFYGRSTIKLRNSETDPTLLREQVYVEMLRAIGAPSQETVKTRVYFNKKAYGLLELQDEAFDEGFINQLFYGNSTQKPASMGVPLDCSTGADFSAAGPYDAFQQKNPARAETNSRVAAMSKALAALDVTNQGAIDQFEKSWFDIESFFKAMAMEYLTGHWDGYWYFSTNFVVYDDPTESAQGTNKFYFIDQDFDQTFGSAFGPPYSPPGAQATASSYKELVGRQWKLDAFDAPNRAMVDKLMKPPSILVPRFEKTLSGIVKSVFNPDILNSKLEALVKRYRPEVEWDRQIQRPHQGLSLWTIQDFDAGLKGPTGTVGWGLTQWVQERATAVAKEFNFEWDKTPLALVNTVVSTKPNESFTNTRTSDGFAIRPASVLLAAAAAALAVLV